MFYFVPYWYGENKTTAFDDTVNQIRMFESAHEKSETIIWDYAPQMRCFLHQQGLSLETSWSVFDTIQNVTDMYAKIIDFNDLDWPAAAEFVYTPFRINVVVKGKIYADVSFGIESQLSTINYFDNDQISKALIFDDRGFLSSIVHFEMGKKTTQEYLDRAGLWQIRVTYLSEGEAVVVNPLFYERFDKRGYQNLNNLIQEVINDHFNSASDLGQSTLVIAAHEKYNQVLLKLAHRPKNLVLSFFRNRYDYKKNDQLLIEELSVANFAITDTQGQLEDIKQIVLSNNNSQLVTKLQHISPYDTRFQLGNSQQVKGLKIFLTVQEMPENQIVFVLTTILAAMTHNPLIELCIASSEKNNIKSLEVYLKKALAQYFHLEMNDVLTDIPLDSETGENQLETSESNTDQKSEVVDLYKRVRIETFETENAIIQAFKTVRLIIDVSRRPNIYIQIAGISAGIPQINLTTSPYIVDKKNGLILQEISELNQAITYYFNGLRHWNESLVYSVRQIRQYTDGAIVNQWQRLLGEHNE